MVDIIIKAVIMFLSLRGITATAEAIMIYGQAKKGAPDAPSENIVSMREIIIMMVLVTAILIAATGYLLFAV